MRLTREFIELQGFRYETNIEERCLLSQSDGMMRFMN
jgi:hypothetical protein